MSADPLEILRAFIAANSKGNTEAEALAFEEVRNALDAIEAKLIGHSFLQRQAKTELEARIEAVKARGAAEGETKAARYDRDEAVRDRLGSEQAWQDTRRALAFAEGFIAVNPEAYKAYQQVAKPSLHVVNYDNPHAHNFVGKRIERERM